MHRPKLLFVLAALGVGLSFGVPAANATPGDSCDPQLPGQCDPCNRETCQFVGNPAVPLCVDGSGSATNAPGFTPFCPAGTNNPPFPGCWTECSLNVDGNPQCAPNDAWCGVGVCGGDECSDDPFATGDGCVPVDPPVPPNLVCDDTPGICGNGVCEPGENGTGENCDNCLDCLTPDGLCDNQTGQQCQLNDANCEDGDVCTTSTCVGPSDTASTCTPPVVLGCSGDTLDGCCPSGCNPREGTACGNQVNCDADCIPEPLPSPSPSPVPPPLVGCLQGSGSVFGSGGAGCNDWSCSFHPFAQEASGGGMVAFLGILGSAIYALIRSKKISN